MAKYLSSSNIKVFPTAFRGKDANDKIIDPNAFLTTEENFVNIANKVTYLGKNYFFDDGDTIHLILGGYYFVFSMNAVTSQFTSPTTGAKICAGIDIDNLTTSYESYQAKVLTPNGGSAGDVLDDATGDVQEFKGLTFFLDSETATFTYDLPLFEYQSGWKKIASSKLNISTEQIRNGIGSSTSIASEFTTVTLNTNDINVSGDIHASTSGSHAVGESSVPFKSAYMSDIYVANINALSGPNLNVSASNYNITAPTAITLSTGVYTLQASSVNATASSNITFATSKNFIINASGANLSLTNGRIVASTLNSFDIEAGSYVDVVAFGSMGITITADAGPFKVNAPQAVFNTIYTLSTTSNALCLSNTASLGTRNLELHRFDTINIDSLNIKGSSSFESISISGLESINLNGYTVRPYEHRLMITGIDSQLSHRATIIANPRFAFSQVLSTEGTLLTALNDASYYIGKTINNSSVTSPLVATGKLLWHDYNTQSYIAYNIMGIGAGTSHGAPILRCMCFKEGIEDTSAQVIDMDGFTIDIRDLV